MDANDPHDTDQAAKEEHARDGELPCSGHLQFPDFVNREQKDEA